MEFDKLEGAAATIGFGFNFDLALFGDPVDGFQSGGLLKRRWWLVGGLWKKVVGDYIRIWGKIKKVKNILGAKFESSKEMWL